MSLFFQKHSEEMISGIIVGVAGAVAFGVMCWLWAKWVAAWSKRENRRELIEHLEIAAVNLVFNTPNYLRDDPKNPFPLIHPQTGQVIPRTRETILEMVGKGQEAAMAPYLFRGLFSFSKRQREMLFEVNRRLSVFGSTVAYYGCSVQHERQRLSPYGRGEPGEKIDRSHVEQAWSNLVLAVGDMKTKDRVLYRALKPRYRFFPMFMPKLPGDLIKRVGPTFTEDFGHRADDEKSAA